MNHVFKTIRKKTKGFANTTIVVSENASSLSRTTDNRSALSHDIKTADIFTATKQALNVSMASLLFVSSLQADIIADKSAPITQQPTILLTNSGATQVNIQTPTAAGISMNQYTQFDTKNNGTIINNSRTNTNTLTAGWVQGNPWLATGSAKAIVNQVNSSNPSNLTGNIEIAGVKADFIIANPSGISVNGANIINAGTATLTTGTPTMNNGSLSGFNVQGGTVSIQGAGLNALGSDYTNILARAAVINANLWANDLKVVTGTNEISADASVITAQASSLPAPLFAIDSSAIGGMYANKITLIGTQNGVGVNNFGTINAGTIAIDANGMLTNTGIVAANTNVIKSTNLNNSGTISSNSKTTIDTEEALINNGMINSDGELNINAKDIDNSLTGEISAATNFINASNKIINHGLIDGNDNVLKTGILENIGTGRIYGDWLALQAVTLNNIDETANSLNSSATIAARENLELGAQTLNNIEHSLIYSGGDMNIGGSLDGNGLAIGKASEINNLSATIESNGYMSLASEETNNINMHLVIEQVSGPTIYQELVKPASGANAGEFDLSSNFVGIEGSQDDNYHKDALVYMKQRDEYEAEYLKTHTGWQALTLYADQEYQRLSAIIDSYIFEDYTLLKQYSTTSHTELVSSDPAQIISGGDMYIDGLLHNKDSHVIAGGTIVTTLNPENLETKGQDITSFDGSTIERTTVEADGWFGGHEREWHGAASYDQADKKSELYSLGTSKYLENTKTAGSATAIGALPSNSIYIISPNAPDYLVQTDPRFTDYKNFLSSDYMLSSLGIDPVDMHKRLGDGYYEQRLVQDQIASLTGKRFLDDYSNNEDQYKALMNAGVEIASQFNLTVGVALSAEQISRLTTDIVWMEEQTINGQKVLTPKVYLAANKTTVNTNGALVSASSIVTTGSNDLFNNGTIIADNAISLNSAGLINNDTGNIKAESIALRANDININRGNVEANSAMVLDAANNINIASQTYSTSNTDGKSSFSRTGMQNNANIAVNNSDGLLLVNAGNDINLNSANIISNGIFTQFQSGNDINLGTVQASEQNNVVWDDKNHLKEGYTQEVGSTISTAGDNVILANHDINVKGSNIDSAEGYTTLATAKGGDINIEAATDTYNYDEATYIKTSSLLGSKKTTNVETINSSSSVASNITGAKVLLASGNDISVTGSNVISDYGTTLEADNDINILLSNDIFAQTYFNEVKKSGIFSSGGLSLTVGMSNNSLATTYSETTNSGSMVGSLYGDTTIGAGNDYKQVASDVISGHVDDEGNFLASGDTSITAKSIDIEAGSDTYDGSSLSKSKTSGLTVALSVPVVNAISDVVTSASDIGESKNTRVNAMAAANTAIDAYLAGKAIENLESAKDIKNGASLSITLGSSSSKSQSSYKGTSAVSSNIAGNNVSITATGAGENSDINIVGSNAAGVSSTSLKADSDINILAATSTNEDHSLNKSSGWNVGAVVSAGKEGIGVGATAGVSAGKGKSKGKGVTYASSHIGSLTGTTTITAGDDANIIGGQALGDKITLTADNLNIQSLQDTVTYDSKQKNGSIQGTLMFGGGGSVSGSYSQSNIAADYASVNEQSGIIAGDKGYSVEVENHTNLIGGIITSTQIAEDDKLNSFSTGTLSYADINNFSRYEGDSIGISATASYSFPSPETQTSATDTTTTPAAGQEEGKFGTSKSIGYGSDSDSGASTTYAGINTSNITITGNETLNQVWNDDESKTITMDNISDIHTDTTTDQVEANSGKLTNTFYAEAVQHELNVQTRVTQTFDTNRQEIKDEIYANIKDKEGEASKIRLANDGYATEKSIKLDQEAQSLRDTVKWADIVMGGIYAGTDSDMLKLIGAETQSDLAYQAAISGGRYFIQTCDKPNQNCSYREVTLGQIQPSDTTGLITVSNPGIFNSIEDALKNASKQNSTTTNQGGIVVIDNPPTGSFIAEGLYALYDKVNDITGAYLPLSAAEQSNVDLKLYALDSGYTLDTSSHSRGGITESVSLQYLNNILGTTDIPINQSRFYGTATNVQDYANQLVINGQGEAYSAVHATDFVGRTPWLLFRSKYFVGGNEPTGGYDTNTFFYSHDKYYYEIPPETIVVNSKIIDNSEERNKFIEAWGDNPTASQPQIVNPIIKGGQQ